MAKGKVSFKQEICKGCGLCVSVCPTNPKSLLMFNEFETVEDALASWPVKKKKGEDNE